MKIFFICILIYSVYAYNCKIAFRLDNIQDYINTSTQINIINIFTKHNIPLSIGIIWDSFGSDKNLTSYIKQVISNNYNIEVCSTDTQIMKYLSFEDQINVLNQSRLSIQSKLSNIKLIRTFIPPYGFYLPITLKAMLLTNYTTISSLTHGSCKNQTLQPIYEYPGLPLDYTTNPLLPPYGGILYNETFNLIKNRTYKCGGKSVYVLNSNTIDDSMLYHLEELLINIKNYLPNCEFSLLSNLHNSYINDSFISSSNNLFYFQSNHLLLILILIFIIYYFILK